MKGELILNVINIAETSMTKAAIDGLSMGNNFRGIMRGVKPLEFVSVDEAVEISPGLEVKLIS